MPLIPLRNESEDQFPLPALARRRYGRFGFPALPPRRSYCSSNFVQTLDGIVSYRDLPGRGTAREISGGSAEDRWVAQLLRAHHDALLLGAGTLREEPARDGRGYDYGRLAPLWRAYRRRVLGRERSLVIILTASGDLDLEARLFAAPATETWILTTETGARRLQRQAAPPVPPRIVALGRGLLAPAELLRWLRGQGVRRVLCESGPTLYAQFFAAGLVDEEFRTIALQVAGVAAPPAPARPTAYDQLSFRPESAPWERVISVHVAPPHHIFLRLRREGRAARGSPHRV